MASTLRKVVFPTAALILFLPVAVVGQTPHMDVGKEVCVGCHEILMEGDFVHGPVAAGECGLCHALRSTQGATTVELLNSGNQLCLDCHQDKQPSPADRHIHPPVSTERCTRCHDPHRSQFPFQLVASTERIENENLCLSCHDGIEHSIESDHRHPAVESGCQTCHRTHLTGSPHHLVEEPPELCSQCHDTGVEGLTQAHRKQPFQSASCTSCHNPHGSNREGLIHRYSHGPFAAGTCEVCHQPAFGGEINLVLEGSNQLCLECHQEKGSRIEAAAVRHPALDVGTCRSCHSPHASPFDKQVRRKAPGLCTECHSRMGEALAASQVVHAPVVEVGCPLCHDPHAGDREFMLRKEANSLCLSCHGKGGSGDPDNARFLDQAGVSEEFLGRALKLGLNLQGRDHPVMRHPVSGRPDPSREGKNLSCVSCHNPHYGEVPAMLVQDSRGFRLCIVCH